MIKTVFRLVVLLLLVIGWGLAALSLHVVRTPGEIPITLVTKDSFGLTDTYVDTRAWTLDDVGNHKLLVQKLLRSGKADVLKHVIKDNADVSAKLTDALQHAPVDHAKAATTEQTVKEAAGFLGFFK